MSITGDTQLAPTKQDIVTSIVQRELMFQAKLAPYLRDVSMFATKGSKTISFPKFNSFTVENRASGGRFTPQALNATKDTLTLGIRAGVAWEIDPMDEIESTVEVQSEFIKRATSSHARYFDSSAIAVMLAAAGNTPAGANQTLSKAAILSLQEFLLTNNSDLSRMALAISVASRTDMLNIDGFVTYNGTGQTPAANVSGLIGFILGMPVIVHNGLAAKQAICWDSEGVCFGLQKGPSYDEQKDVTLGSNAKIAVVDQKYGIAALQLAVEGEDSTHSPLIAKLST